MYVCHLVAALSGKGARLLLYRFQTSAPSFVGILALAEKASPGWIQRKAAMALSVAATDEAMAILERMLDRARAEKAQASVQALSVGSEEAGEKEAEVDRDIELLEMYLDYAKSGRAGLR